MPDVDDVAPGNPDQPTDAPAAHATPDQPAGGETDDALDSFDLSQVPEDANREWLAQRHQQMTGSLTRKSQELAEQRRQVAGIVQAIQDPEHPDHDAIVAELGLDTGTILDDEDDLSDDYDDRIEKLEQQLQQRKEADEEAQLEQAEAQWISNALKDLEAEVGSEFTKEERSIVEAYAVSNRFDDGEPDIKGGYERLNAAWDAKQKAYEKSKRAPRGPGAGKSAAREQDTSTRQKRIELGAQVAEAAAQDA